MTIDRSMSPTDISHHIKPPQSPFTGSCKVRYGPSFPNRRHHMIDLKSHDGRVQKYSTPGQRQILSLSLFIHLFNNNNQRTILRRKGHSKPCYLPLSLSLSQITTQANRIAFEKALVPHFPYFVIEVLKWKYASIDVPTPLRSKSLKGKYHSH